MKGRESYWVEQAAEGSEEGYRKILESYQRPVFSIVVRMVRDHGLAEDLTQETFVKAFRALPSFDRGRKFSSWLFTIAHNTTIDHLRRKRLPTVSLDSQRAEDEGGYSLENLAVAGEASPEEELSHTELGDALEESLGRLRPEYAEVLILRFQEGLSYDEISEITGLPLGTVKTHLYRARKALAERLKKRGWSSSAVPSRR